MGNGTGLVLLFTCCWAARYASFVLNENFVFLGLVFGAIGVGSYLVAILQGRVQPNRLSWFILGLAPLLAFAAEIDEGVGLRSVMTFWVGFGPLLIFFASFVNKSAYWKLTRFDIVCASLSVLALVLWQLTGSGNITIALTIIADGLAVLPILVKSWRFPHTEVPWPFLGAMANSAIALLVLDRFTFADLAWPTYIFVSCLILVGTLLVRKHVVDAPETNGAGA